jgi:hypothetical protein
MTSVVAEDVLGGETVIAIVAVVSSITQLVLSPFILHRVDKAPFWLRRLLVSPILLLAIFVVCARHTSFSHDVSVIIAWGVVVGFLVPMALVECFARAAVSQIATAVFFGVAWMPVVYVFAGNISGISVWYVMSVTGAIVVGTLGIAYVFVRTRQHAHGHEGIENFTRAILLTALVIESLCITYVAGNGVYELTTLGDIENAEEIAGYDEGKTAAATILSATVVLAAIRVFIGLKSNGYIGSKTYAPL